MATKKRNFELHKLTISGLVGGTDYRILIRDSRQRMAGLQDAIWEHGGKSHALEDLNLVEKADPTQNELRLRFLSYKTGYRPDVLDTEDFTIEPNPLRRNQTGIDYTHAILVNHGGRWVMVLEKVQGGAWPQAIGLYLNWMLDTVGVPPEMREDSNEEIVVSVEPQPGEAFIQRIDELDRVTKASLRVVRPNPGWADLEETLGDEAGASNAARADVTMAAKPRSTLQKASGIIGRIKTLFRLGRLGHAEVAGVKNGVEEKFTTEQLGQKAQRKVQLDANGQVIPADAYAQMERIVEPQQEPEQEQPQ